MTSSRAAALLQSKIKDASGPEVDSALFRMRVLRAICSVVAFDSACLATVDPATMLPTGLTSVGFDDPESDRLAAAAEFGPVPIENTFESVARLPTGIRTTRDAVGGELHRSRHYRELLAPLGLSDDVRMVFRGRDGATWGIGLLGRRTGRIFDEAEVRTLARALPYIGDGLRTTLLRGVHASGDVRGPAVVVVDAENEPTAVTPEAAHCLESIAWNHGDRHGLMSPVILAAAQFRRFGEARAVTRMRTTDGAWLVLRAGWLRSEREPGRIAVALEPARPPEVVSLVAAVHGLTVRESEVLTEILAGHTRDRIAAKLSISPYTVQDHLKSIFTKTGTNSCRTLVAHLVGTQYLPRIGSEVGPNGWFAAS